MAAARLHYRLGELDHAEALARSALPFQEVAWDLLANIAIQRDRLDEAQSLLEQAVAHRGSHLAPLLTQIQLLLHQERYAEALEVCEDTEREFGDRGDRSSIRGLYMHKGRALIALGRLAEAQAALRTEIEESPEALSAYSLLAFAYAANGQVKEMQETFREMLETNDTPAAHAEAVRAIQGLGDLASASALLQRSLARWPNDPTLRKLAR